MSQTLFHCILFIYNIILSMKKTYKYLSLSILFILSWTICTFLFENSYEVQGTDYALYPITFIVTVALYWLFEEIVFRWFFQEFLYYITWLKKNINSNLKVLFSIICVSLPSILFFLVHPWAPFFYLFLSFFLGIVYHYNRDIYLNVFIHTSNNIFFSIMLILNV